MPDKLTCQRCDYTWKPRLAGTKPKTCPKCKSLAWDKPMSDYWRAVREQNQRNKQHD